MRVSLLYPNYGRLGPCRPAHRREPLASMVRCVTPVLPDQRAVQRSAARCHDQDRLSAVPFIALHTSVLILRYSNSVFLPVILHFSLSSTPPMSIRTHTVLHTQAEEEGPRAHAPGHLAQSDGRLLHQLDRVAVHCPRVPVHRRTSKQCFDHRIIVLTFVLLNFTEYGTT